MGFLKTILKVLGIENFTLSFIIIILTLFFLLHIFPQLYQKDPSKPPVVFHWFPFIGSTIQYGLDPYKFFQKQKKKHGNIFTFILLGKKMTVALGPKGNDLVFNGKLSSLSAEEAYTRLTTPVFGTDVVYDVPNHVLMEQKKFVKTGLTIETFRTYVPLIVEEVKMYLETSPIFGKNKLSGISSLMKALPEITIFTASRTLQGKEVRNNFDASFAKLYHDLDGGFTPINFLIPWLPLPKNRLRDAAQKKMAQIYMDIIKQRRKTCQHEEEDMIWNLMNQHYKDGRKLTDKEIAHLMIAILMAGQHTSAATGCWALLHLAEKPEYIKLLLEEQRKVFGDNLDNLTYDNLKDMELLSYVIRETLRLHPPLHSIIRKVKSPILIEDSLYIVPENHYLLAAPGISSIDEEYFKNALEFIPERWKYEKNTENPDKIDYGYGLVTKGAFSPYLPFGAGRHRCIGEQFAYMQLGTIITTFVHELEWTLPKNQTTIPKPDYASMVVLPERPSNIEWRKRQRN
ncbi:hypothetical protein PNEG_01069 [Pneumocystis murina B123]|uniref:Lanosterol 14-alpha demethylase n=1 Tax=Pneumocystis murina (strain B123) TaxID=1069680 RepID=M7NQC8_PNEMU|nr:hypothetical protein PNEG_01069 [Pneumocystis murina B123]EMR10923.1 hypothetical protein PNEG_01069 [Pneumocystis murina B123]